MFAILTEAISWEYVTKNGSFKDRDPLISIRYDVYFYWEGSFPAKKNVTYTLRMRDLNSVQLCLQHPLVLAIFNNACLRNH